MVTRETGELWGDRVERRETTRWNGNEDSVGRPEGERERDRGRETRTEKGGRVEDGEIRYSGRSGPGVFPLVEIPPPSLIKALSPCT